MREGENTRKTKMPREGRAPSRPGFYNAPSGACWTDAVVRDLPQRVGGYGIGGGRSGMRRPAEGGGLGRREGGGGEWEGTWKMEAVESGGLRKVEDMEKGGCGSRKRGTNEKTSPPQIAEAAKSA